MGSIKHAKTSPVPNPLGDTRRVGGGDWNSEHIIDLEVSDIDGLEARLIPVEQVEQFRDDALQFRNEAAGSASDAADSAAEAAATVGSLAAPGGAELVGAGSEGTVQDALYGRPTTQALAADDGADIVRLATSQGLNVTALQKLSKRSLGGGMPDPGSSGKVVIQRATITPAGGGAAITSRLWVVSAWARNGGAALFQELRRNSVTPNGSLGAPGELLRVTTVAGLIDAWLGRHVYSAVSAPGDWVETAYAPVGAGTRYEHGELVGYYWAGSGSAAKSIEFSFQFNREGKAVIRLYCTPGSTDAAPLSLDGIPYATLNLRSAVAAIYDFEIRGVPGANHIAKLDKPAGTPNTSVNVFGMNYGSVRNYPGYMFASGMCAWGNDVLYTQGEGATDYAILNSTSGLFGGSFHGGETYLSDSWTVDGAVMAASPNMQICESFLLNQKTRISWNSIVPAGGILDVVSSHAFTSGAGYTFSATFAGDVNVTSFFAGMATTPTAYSEVSRPAILDLAGAPDGFKTLPRSNVVEQVNPTNGRRILTEVTLQDDDEANPYGGPSIDRTAASYNKMYSGPAIASATPIPVTSFSFAMRKMFF